MKNSAKRIVLLVEDELITAAATAIKLNTFGYEVLTANTGEKALETAVRNNQIDLILMDIDLGKGIDGTECARRILDKKNIPIVFLTSHTEKDFVDRVKALTRYGYVVKNSGDFVLNSSIEMAFELFEAHEKTKEKEKLYLQTLESIPDTSILLFDHEHRYQITGGDELRKAGFDNKLIIGKTLREAFPQEIVETFEHRYEKALAGEKSSFELEYGNMIFHEQVLPVRNLHGEICNGMVIAHNITERKRAEAALTKAENRLRAALDATPFPIAVIDLLDEKIHYWSRSALELFGHTAPTTAEWHQIAFPDPDYRREVIDRWNRFLGISRQTGKAVNAGEYRVACADGSVRICECYATFIPDNLIVTFNDITERKRTDEMLKKSEMKYRSLIENTSDVVFCVNEKGEYQFANSVFASTFGKTPDYFIGKTFWDIYPKEHADHRQAASRKVFETGETQSVEVTVPLPDKTMYFLAKANPIKDDDGNVILNVTIATDITERKLAEEKIKTLLNEKDLLLKEVHHRVKNNMAVIISLLSLQAGSAEDPSVIAALENAGHRLKSMEALYDKLYRSENLQDLSIKEYFSYLADEIISLFPNKGIIKIEKQIEDFTLEVKMLSSLGIIVSEILSNSMKYAFNGRDRGLITISAFKAGNRATITVGDDGVGISESVDFKTTAGFGLQLIYLLSQQIGGDIQIERKKGTKYVLNFEVR